MPSPVRTPRRPWQVSQAANRERCCGGGGGARACLIPRCASLAAEHGAELRCRSLYIFFQAAVDCLAPTIVASRSAASRRLAQAAQSREQAAQPQLSPPEHQARHLPQWRRLAEAAVGWARQAARPWAAADAALAALCCGVDLDGPQLAVLWHGVLCIAWMLAIAAAFHMLPPSAAAAHP